MTPLVGCQHCNGTGTIRWYRHGINPRDYPETECSCLRRRRCAACDKWGDVSEMHQSVCGLLFWCDETCCTECEEE